MTDRRSAGGFPGGARFAFTILDDTDDATLANVRPVYDLLGELGFRTTKTVWPLDCPADERGPFFAAQTLQDPAYLAFVKMLVGQGFEVAFHNATMGSSVRGRTVRGLEFLKEHFGFVPELHCNHGLNRENLYWGPNRYRTLFFRVLAFVAARVTGQPRFEGERPDSPYFWGDLCHQHIRFVRSFTHRTLTPGKAWPGTPYRLTSTPWVRYWFCTVDAPNVRAFRRVVSLRAVTRLCERGGACIVSTHLGKGFTRDGRVDGAVEETLRYLATLPGWFVPVSTILDHLVRQEPNPYLKAPARWRLEAAHLLDRLLGMLVRHAHV